MENDSRVRYWPQLAVTELLSFLEQRQQGRNHSPNNLLVSTILRIFCIHTKQPLANYSDDSRIQLFAMVTRVDVKEFEAKMLIQRTSQQVFLYSIIAGSVKRAIRAGRVDRGSVMEKTLRNGMKNQCETQNGHILVSDENSSVRCVSKVKTIRMELQNYYQIIEFVHRYQDDLICHFVGTAFRLDERFLKDFKIAEKFEVIELKKGKQINSFAKGIYLLKYGLAELTYLCSGIKIVVNEGSIISESALQNCKMSVLFIQASMMFYFGPKVLEDLEKQFPGFRPHYSRVCEQVHTARMNYLRASIRKTEDQEETDLDFEPPKMKNLKINRKRVNMKRFRKTQADLGEADETYLKFISSLPYERYIESEELITQKCLAKSKAKKAEKIMTYLKRSQIKRKKSNEKFLALKMKTIAEKAMQSGRGYVKFDYKQPSLQFQKGLFHEQDEDIEIHEQKQELLLDANDTGLINELVKDSRSYQKQISYLVHSKENFNAKHEKMDCRDNSRGLLEDWVRAYIKTYQNKNNIRKGFRCLHTTCDSNTTYYNNFIECCESNKQQKQPNKRSIMRRTTSGKVVKIKRQF